MEKEKETANEWKRLVRMNEQDRVSQASSLVTISSFPVHGKCDSCTLLLQGSDGKVQTFGKRDRAVKRDPNCPVVIRGWLYKQDSSGLKLWKRRWFVLSDFCLFYYKDSREESVLGSIPLPSYTILFCTPRECKNRKYAFKAVHQGMRSYFFSADTQEDMLGWVRALSQSATMETETSLNRRCSSYQDFTRMGGSSESLDLPDTPCLRNGPTHLSMQGDGSQNETGSLVGGKMGTPQIEQRGKRRSARQSPSPRTSTPTNSGGQRKRGQSLSQEGAEPDSLPLNYSNQTSPQSMKSTGPRPLTPRGQLGSRPHTPVGRVDIRPQDDLLLPPQAMGSAPPSPKLDFGSTSHTPTMEKRHMLNKPPSAYCGPHPVSSMRRAAGKACSTGGQAGLLPPLPPPRVAPVPSPPHHHHHHRSHMSVCLLQPSMAAPSDLFQERDQQQMRPPESDVDAVLTRLCGCDKLLQSLSIELAQLQADKDNVQCALEMARLQLDEWKAQGFRGQSIRGQEGLLSQKALLQDDLVTIRARMCDVSIEMERVWSQYERMESELSVLRSHLQHICRFGRPQEQSQAQRELWMMEDILCGLKTNRNHFRVILGSPRQIVPSPMLQKSVLHPGAPGPQTDGFQNEVSMRVESEPPPRPPLPQELQETNQDREVEQGWTGSEAELEALCSGVSSHHRSDQLGNNLPILSGDRKKSDTMPASLPGITASSWSTPDTANKRVRMSEEEQRERMKRNQERLANQKKTPTLNHTNPSQCQRPSPSREEPPFPLRVTRVLTAVLPSTLVARRVSVEDPPPELATPFPEQISPGEHAPDPKKKPQKKHREMLLEKSYANANWLTTEIRKDGPVWDHQEPSSEMPEFKSNLAEELPFQNQNKTKVEDDSSPLSNRRCMKSSTSQMTGLTEEKPPFTEAPDAVAEKPHTPLKREWSMSGNGSLPSDLRSHDEEGGPAFTVGVLANGRREKVAGRPPFLVSDLDIDPDLCLTPEQRDAKLRRVERIRERVIRSAARESNVQLHTPQTRSSIERLMNHSFSRANETSEREISARLGGLGECCCAEGVDYGSCCHSNQDPDLSINMTTEPHPSRVPYLNVNKGEGSVDDESSDQKKMTQIPLEDDSSIADIISCHNRKGVPRKQFISTNHITKLIVFPTNRSLESTQSEGNSHLFHCKTKELEEITVNQNECHFMPTNRRAEWFLSTNKNVEIIPLFNPSTHLVSSDNATIHDHNNTTCDFTFLPTVTNVPSESLTSAAKQSLDSLQEDASSTFPDSSEQIAGTATQSTVIHSSSPKDTPEHSHWPALLKQNSGMEESDKPEIDKPEDSTLFASQKEAEQTTNETQESQKLAASPNEKQLTLDNQNQGGDSPDVEENDTSNQRTQCATIHFESTPGSTANHNVEGDTETILSNKTQDPQLVNQNISPALNVKHTSHSSQASASELHIYEEIACSTTSSKVQGNRSLDSLQMVNELSSSNSVLRSNTTALPSDWPNHSTSSIQSAETEMGKVNEQTDLSVGNKLSTVVKTESKGTNESLEFSEGKGKEVLLRRDLVNLNSKFKSGNDNQSSQFIKARVTVVRTSL